jgi:hypothetical protein
MNRIVLIGDIIGSRKIENRGEVQKQLEEVFQLIHKEASNIISNFTITLGDEFQAVFSNADNIFYYLRRIENFIFPVKVRFALGIGKIMTPIKKKAIGMDGPAFYSAREGMSKLKSSHSRIIVNGEIEDINLVNENLSLLSFLTRGWKLNRSLVLEMMYQGKSIKQIARRLGITERAVYKTINSGALQILKSLSDELSIKLNKNLEVK